MLTLLCDQIGDGVSWRAFWDVMQQTKCPLPVKPLIKVGDRLVSKGQYAEAFQVYGAIKATKQLKQLATTCSQFDDFVDVALEALRAIESI